MKRDWASELRAIADGRLMLNVRNGVTVSRSMLAMIADEIDALRAALPTPAEAGGLVAEWREAMEGVTPGPWTLIPAREYDGDDDDLMGSYTSPASIEGDDGNPVCTFGSEDGSGTLFENEANHRFVERCSPDNISALLTALEAQAAELAAVRGRHPNPADFRYWEGRYRDEEAENERLSTALASERAAHAAKDAEIARLTAEKDAAEFAARNSKSLDGDALHAVRALLDSAGVPKAAFIDDHVGNAIAQRDAERAAHAETKDRLVEALKALEPFARNVELIHPGAQDHDRLCDYGSQFNGTPTVGQARAARRALTGGKS